MTHIISAASVPKRRIAVTVLVCALLSIAASMAMSSGTASAATGSCDPGDFCLYWGANWTGGLYEFAGSDGNLHNDFFENTHTNVIVGDNTQSVWNRGVNDPSGLVDVVAHEYPAPLRGNGLCIRQGRQANLPVNWRDRISSYRWVTPATCNLYPQL